MAQYRKIPTVIDAIQYDGDNLQELIDFTNGAVKPGPTWSAEPFIDTEAGKMVFGQGEWIIKGVEGEFYPCKDSIFKLTYEEVAV